MRAAKFALALLMAAPALLVQGVVTTTTSVNTYSAANCAGTATGTTPAVDTCVTAGTASYKILCTGARHGAFTINQYPGSTDCTVVTAVPVTGATKDTCVTAPVLQTSTPFRVDCLVPCTADAACGGHGTCTVATGICACTGGYTGDTCATAPACPTGSDQCGAHGACSNDQSECVCTDGYSGEACADAPACSTSGNANYCGATNGYCNTDYDGCTCTNGYTGPLCTIAPAANACPTASDQCGAHGACNAAQTACACTGGYRGNTCQDYLCDSTSCVHGTCASNVCTCDDEHAGPTCSAEKADHATVTFYSGTECKGTATRTLDSISLDTCTVAGTDSIKVLCDDGVNGAWTVNAYSDSTTCGGTASPHEGTSNMYCLAAGETDSAMVVCKKSGAIAIQASMFLVAALAIFSKIMQ